MRVRPRGRLVCRACLQVHRRPSLFSPSSARHFPAGREVRVVRDSLDTITGCARHARDAAMRVGTGGGR